MKMDAKTAKAIERIMKGMWDSLSVTAQLPDGSTKTGIMLFKWNRLVYILTALDGMLHDENSGVHPNHSGLHSGDDGDPVLAAEPCMFTDGLPLDAVRVALNKHLDYSDTEGAYDREGAVGVAESGTPDHTELHGRYVITLSFVVALEEGIHAREIVVLTPDGKGVLLP